MSTSKVKKCSQCRDGEIDAPADFRVEGFRTLASGRKCPFKAYLCDGHVEVVQEQDEPVTILKIEKLDQHVNT